MSKSNKEKEEFLTEMAASFVKDDGELLIDHTNMEFPKELKEFDFSEAIKEARSKKTAHLKRKFWIQYRDGLEEALSKRYDRLKGTKKSFIERNNYNWEELLVLVNSRIEELHKQVKSDIIQGIHPIKGKPEPNKGRPPAFDEQDEELLKELKGYGEQALQSDHVNTPTEFWEELEIIISKNITKIAASTLRKNYRHIFADLLDKI